MVTDNKLIINNLNPYFAVTIDMSQKVLYKREYIKDHVCSNDSFSTHVFIYYFNSDNGDSSISDRKSAY